MFLYLYCIFLKNWDYGNGMITQFHVCVRDGPVCAGTPGNAPTHVCLCFCDQQSPLFCLPWASVQVFSRLETHQDPPWRTRLLFLLRTSSNVHLISSYQISSRELTLMLLKNQSDHQDSKPSIVTPHWLGHESSLRLLLFSRLLIKKKIVISLSLIFSF